jgi:adenylate kinase family enzyme
VVNRIMTVGSIGAGKSTVARALGDKLGMDVVELDELWWLPGSYERSPSLVNVKTMPRGEWVRLNEELVDGDTWLIDGSLDLLALRLARADTVVFIDLPRRVCMWRVLKRTYRSLRSQRRLPSRATVQWLWVLSGWIWKYPRKRARILSQIAEHAANAEIIRLRSPKAVKAFLRSVGS